MDVAPEPKYLGADIGFLSVVHAWGQPSSIKDTHWIGYDPYQLQVWDGRYGAPIRASSPFATHRENHRLSTWM